MPLIERFEYIVVSIWFLVVLPNICIKLWAACRAVKRISPIKQHTSLIVFLILFFVLSNVLDERRLIRQFADLYDNFSFYFVYAYIPLLFLIVQFKPQKDTGEQNQ